MTSQPPCPLAPLPPNPIAPLPQLCLRQARVPGRFALSLCAGFECFVLLVFAFSPGIIVAVFSLLLWGGVKEDLRFWGFASLFILFWLIYVDIVAAVFGVLIIPLLLLLSFSFFKIKYYYPDLHSEFFLIILFIFINFSTVVNVRCGLNKGRDMI